MTIMTGLPKDGETSTVVDEHSPLLLPGRTPDSAKSLQDDGDEARAQPLTHRNISLCAAIIILNAMLSVSGLFQALPLNQVLESNICAQLHLDDHGSGSCGENSIVQGELAMLRGCHAMVSLIPGKFTAPTNILRQDHGYESGCKFECWHTWLETTALA